MNVVDAPLSDGLIEGLLFEGEGAALDGERGPYPFEGADADRLATRDLDKLLNELGDAQ